MKTSILLIALLLTGCCASSPSCGLIYGPGGVDQGHTVSMNWTSGGHFHTQTFNVYSH